MFSSRVRTMAPSATVELNNKVVDLKSKGIDIISFNIGEPDFHTPEKIKNAAKKALDDNFTKYTNVAGIVELREAICRKLKMDNNLDYRPNQICVSTGAKQAIANLLLAICDTGDEVIVPTPCWVSYIDMIKLAGGTPVLVETYEKSGFQLDMERIEAAITKNTRAVLINTPNNPTGAVYSIEVLARLGELALKHDFYIIADEIYEKLIYNGKRHVSVASLSPDIKEKTVVINGFSKAYAMTGWRIGYAAGPKAVIEVINLIQGHTTSNTNSIAQKACLAALDGPQDGIEKMRQEFDARRKYLVGRLNSMDGIFCLDADGAFYLLPNVSELYGRSCQGKTITNSLDLADYLLEKANIAVVPGIAFEAPAHIRISYSNSLDNIRKGMDRMEEAISQLR